MHDPRAGRGRPPPVSLQTLLSLPMRSNPFDNNYSEIGGYWLVVISFVGNHYGTDPMLLHLHILCA